MPSVFGGILRMPRGLGAQSALALMAGALGVFAFAPFDIFVLAPLSWLVLIALIATTDCPRRAAILGFVWGSGWFTAGLCWLYVALNVYGGMAPPLAGGAILLFCMHLALYIAFGAWLQVRLRSPRPVVNALIVAASFGLAEWLRGAVITTFPWLALGYSQTPPSPMAGWAPIFGVYGTSFLMVLGLALLVHALRARRAWPLLTIMLIAIVGGGAALRTIAWTQPVGEPLQVALLQTNIAQDQKWQRERVESWLALNARMLRDNATQLTILPETTLPMFDHQLPELYLGHFGDLAAAAGGDVILGIFTNDANGGVYNSAITRGLHGQQVYSKNHLVPFGEFAPPGFAWFFKVANIPMSNQSRGGDAQPLFQFGEHKIAMNICYENLFGEELLWALPEAGLMVNISNMAWYGKSHAQPQHLQIARIRALETGRPMLSATNTGMTAAVAPDGAVMATLPEFEAGALHVAVHSYTGRTPYAIWGNWPFLAAVFGVLLCAIFWARRTALPTPR